jgi:hypothetical protein
VSLLETLLGPKAAHAPVRGSTDLNRILELPRRPRPTPEELSALQDKWTAKLAKPDAPCQCQSKFKRRCAKRLLPIQAWALEEASHGRGILGPIGVGDGKTLLDLLVSTVIPGVQQAVLLIPPQLRNQLLEVDWAFYGQHWELPNLAGGKWFKPGRPVLRVVAYSELSQAKATDLLTQVQPDLIIADEGHLLRSKSAARTKRFLRFMTANPRTRFYTWSGTIMAKSLADWAHLSNLALGQGSPTPLNQLTIDEWSAAMDPGPAPIDPGELRQLCEPSEPTRKGFSRRVLDTFGVVSSPDSPNCPASLELRARPLVAPPPVLAALAQLDATWDRPDGESLVDAIAVYRCAKQLSSGFFYRWRWPRGESLEVRKAWLEARKNWNKELREKLKHASEHMDSPLLLTEAAIRWHEGYTYIARDAEGREISRKDVPPHSRSGPRKTWSSEYWPAWKALRDTARPETEPVWVSDYLIQDAAKWLQENKGVAWYEDDAVGSALSALSKCPRYGAGSEASQKILGEDGSRPIIASIRAHGTGKNLQCFSRGLILSPPSSGKDWEQLLGRHHRQGQLADEVVFDLYRHTEPFQTAIEKAVEEAEYIQDVFGGTQKLARATIVDVNKVGK